MSDYIKDVLKDAIEEELSLGGDGGTVMARIGEVLSEEGYKGGGVVKLEPTAEQLELIAKAAGMAVWEMQIAFDIANHEIPEGAPVGTIARRPDGAVIALRGGVCDERFWIYKWLDDDPNVPTVKDTNDADSWPVIYDPREDEAPRLAEAASKPRVFQSADEAGDTPETVKLLREIRDRYEAGEGPHPLSRWANGGSDPTAQQEPEEDDKPEGCTECGFTAYELEDGRCDQCPPPKTPRTPRVVDPLGVDEQGSRWIEGTGHGWKFKFTEGRWWFQTKASNNWTKIQEWNHNYFLRTLGPYTEILEPRVLPSLDCEEARDGTVWQAAFSQTDHGRGWKFWYVLAEREWYTDAGHDGSSPLRTLDFLTERGPYTEVLGDPS